MKTVMWLLNQLEQGKRNDSEAYKMYTDRYFELEKRLKENTRAKSVENVIQLKRLYNINPNFYPTMSPPP